MNVNDLVRPNIQKLKPYTSARDSHLSGILMDANENSFGSVADDPGGLELNRYPDPSQRRIREKYSQISGVKPANLFFGVGSDEIIDLLIRIFCEPGADKVMVPLPTYGMYRVACDIQNVEVIETGLNRNFQVDLDAIEKQWDDSVKIIFLCSPNNPTGNALYREDILKLASEKNAIIVVDEAYIDFAEEKSVIKDVVNYPNLVVMRTFSKAWGLAGVRCGLCAADETVISYLMKVKAPYNLNKLTIAAVLEAMNMLDRKDEMITKIVAERDNLANELEWIDGIHEVLPSDANFLLFRCDDPSGVLGQLAEKGVIIRDRSTQRSLEGCLRVSVGTPAENKKFLNELKDILA